MSGRGAVVGAVTGEGEEDVVERRVLHLDVVDSDRVGVERTHDRGDEAGREAHVDGDVAIAVVDADSLDASLRVSVAVRSGDLR